MYNHHYLLKTKIRSIY